ncbi:MAG: ABC transporter ATP-binding protein [Opitutales bacterium]
MDAHTDRPITRTGETLFKARGLEVTLGERKVLHSIDAAFKHGELFGIIGANGSGKSTCLKGMLGLLPCDSGEISFQGQNFRSYTSRMRAREIAYLPQNAECLWPMTVERVVMLGRLPFLSAWSGPAEDDRTAVSQAMDSVDVGHLAHRPVTEISGGERSRVLLARALAGDPILLFADEPSSGLDPYHELQLMELFRHHVQLRGMTIVVVLHNLALASRFCDRLLLLHEGRIAASGHPKEVLKAGNLEHAYQIEAQVLDVGAERAVIPWSRLRK